MRSFRICLLAASLVAVALQSDAFADRHADRVAARHARGMSWHGPYYNTTWGAPISLVVPPTSNMQVKWGWGVSQDTVTPIYHQFRRPYPAVISGGGFGLLPTPAWPSHTDQFGVYYVRSPY